LDNLCHALAGAALGEAGLKTRTRFGNVALMLSANIPDVDVLVFLTDTSSVSFRRGWTHGIIAQIALPIALTAVFGVVHRLRPPGQDAPPFRTGWLLALAYIGVYSHVFMDLLNNYGVRLLAPFDWRWLYGDSVFIIDLVLWLSLGLGVWLARRRRRPALARRALVVAACYVLAMVVSARVARTMVIDAWRAQRGSEPRAVMVGPRPVTPFTRDVIVDAGDHYEGGTFSWWTREVAWEPEPIPKSGERPEVALVRDDRRVREFLVWARFPFWEIDAEGDAARVVVRDMRFMAGGRQFAVETTVPLR
jgi:inner membrane protein